MIRMMSCNPGNGTNILHNYDCVTNHVAFVRTHKAMTAPGLALRSDLVR